MLALSGQLIVKVAMFEVGYLENLSTYLPCFLLAKCILKHSIIDPSHSPYHIPRVLVTTSTLDQLFTIIKKLLKVKILLVSEITSTVLKGGERLDVL